MSNVGAEKVVVGRGYVRRLVVPFQRRSKTEEFDIVMDPNEF